MSFGDAEHAGKRKQTRCEAFLAEMDQIVPWTDILAHVEPHYPKAGSWDTTRTRLPFSVP